MQLEFGCEFSYLKSHDISPRRSTLDGADVDQYELVVEPYHLLISFPPGSQAPVAFTLYEGDKLTYDIRYVDYVADLEPDLKLFEKPQGIAFEEAK